MVNLTTTQVEILFGELEYIAASLEELDLYEQCRKVCVRKEVLLCGVTAICTKSVDPG